ncbi:MAG: gliding motility lipoprotein GldH [Bacteroidetes bacterium]|nr:gliding motility lipoprotein GldH [Bacteroidota bacterium]MBK9800508.1 gliding motility lipoprotein GldH [Bacteroidota bacterium]MBP6413612.1 gliding motility lipoprotein GldH [Bacteroidia bacterium]
MSALKSFKHLPAISFYLMLLGLLSACDSNRIFEENKEIANGIWNSKNKVQFEVAINDTMQLHNFYINIRNAGAYPYSNLYLFLETEFPDKVYARDTIECILADNSGKWLGEGSGDIWDNQILFKKGVRFRKTGTYRFTLEQAMRVENLPLIMDVGMRIEKATN